MGNLTPLQQRFVEDYAVHGSARGAAKRAGYSGFEHASLRNMRNPAVRKAIEEARMRNVQRVPVEAYQVVDRLRSIAFAEEGKVETKERLAALGLLARHLGMLGPAGSARRPKTDYAALLRSLDAPKAKGPGDVG